MNEPATIQAGSRLAKIGGRVSLQTVLTWTPPTLDLPDRSCRVLLVLESQPDQIHEGWWSAKRQGFGIAIEPASSRQLVPASSIKFWAPALVSQ